MFIPTLTFMSRGRFCSSRVTASGEASTFIPRHPLSEYILVLDHFTGLFAPMSTQKPRYEASSRRSLKNAPSRTSSPACDHEIKTSPARYRLKLTRSGNNDLTRSHIRHKVVFFIFILYHNQRHFDIIMPRQLTHSPKPVHYDHRTTP